MTKRTQAWFVTGTDTEIGKTFVSCALLHAARIQGFTTVGMKPIAAGADDEVDGQRLNEDAAALLRASSIRPHLSILNPYCFASPIAPHVAAAEENVSIDSKHVLQAFESLREQADVVVVEGVGGFRVPLGPDFDTADLAQELNLPVILVVGMRLGCINHALLTAEAIRARGLVLAGWVANRIDPVMLRFDENIEALQSRLHAPLLGITPHGSIEDAARALTLPSGS